MTLTVNIHINLTNWSGSFAYVVGNRIANGGNAYQCITAGTSGVTGTGGPSGTTSNITDGAAHWKWLSAIDYNSLSTLQASLPTTFTQPIVWQFWNNGTITTTTGNSFLVLSGHTTSTTNTLTITTAPGESIRNALATGHTALAFNAAVGASFTAPTAVSGFTFAYLDITDSNVIVDGLQFQDPTVNSSVYLVRGNTGSTGLRLQNCIFDGTAQSNTEILSFNDTVSLINCVITDHQPATPGTQAVTINVSGRVVNCTGAAFNGPTSNGTFILTNTTTANSVIIRNTAAFGYAYLGVAAGSGTGIVADHCSTRSATLGVNVTDGGNNLLNNLAATNLVSSSNDFRLILGSACINAGVADTTDIPSANDIAGTTRPQGTGWDIGAFELNAVNAIGAARSKGRLSPAQQAAPARGKSVAMGRATALINNQFLGSNLGLSKSSGRSTGTLSQIALGDPWSSDFGDGTSNPNTDPFGPLSPYFMAGTSKSNGRALVIAALPLSASGISQSRSRAPLAATVGFVLRGISMGSGHTNVTAARPLIAVAVTASTGRSASINATATLSGIGKATGKGFSIFARKALLSVIGKTSAMGMTTIATPGLPVAFGASTTRGRAAPTYTAPPLNGSGILFGKSLSNAHATLAAIVALSATGKTSTKGFSFYGANVVILFASGAAKAMGQSGSMSQSTTLNAKSQASSQGFGRAIVSQPIAARGVSITRGATTASYLAILNNYGQTSSRGRLSSSALTAGLIARGISATRAKVSSSIVTFIKGLGKATSAAQITPTVIGPLQATGMSQISGQFGFGGALHLSTSRGMSNGVGRASVAGKASLGASGSARCTGRAKLTPSQFNVTVGSSIATGLASASYFSKILALSQSVSSGTITVSVTVSLSATGIATASARSSVRRQAGLVGYGIASGRGHISASTSSAALATVGKAALTGRSASVSFAPVALTGSGRSKTGGAVRISGATILNGAGLGLSQGRCVTIATALLMANGRNKSNGQAAIASAVGFLVRGNAEARGILYNRTTIIGFGSSRSWGSTILAGYYNVVPDTPGPRISALTQLPSFDSMDLGDLDFFSWDWSARVSRIGDPIISATVTASPSGLPVGTVVVVGDIVQAKVGIANLIETFSLRCSVTLRSGRVLHWSAPVSVEDF